MAHRVAAILLVLASLVLLPIRPLASGIVLATALTLVLDRRGVFGRGMFRLAIAFFAGLWVGLAGVVATLLGMVALPGSCDATTTVCDDPEGNFLFLPGVLLLALGLTLLAWSVVGLVRARRAARQPPAWHHPD